MRNFDIYTNTNTSDSYDSVLFQSGALLFTSFTGGFISFIGCGLIYKSMLDRYKARRIKSLTSTCQKFSFCDDKGITYDDSDQDNDSSDSGPKLPKYDDFIQTWVIDRNHNKHKGVDENIRFDYVEEWTPNGLLRMMYRDNEKRFYYWADNTMNYNILCTAARKYCIVYGCVERYLDGYEMPVDSEDENDNDNEEEQISSETDEDDYLFLKPKHPTEKNEDEDGDKDQDKGEESSDSSSSDEKTEISEEEEEIEYIEERYGRYKESNPTLPVPKHLVFINRGNMHEWEELRVQTARSKKIEEWKEMGCSTEINNMDLCTSYADFKDWLKKKENTKEDDEDTEDNDNGETLNDTPTTPPTTPVNAINQLN